MDSGNYKNTFRYVEPKIGQLKGEIWVALDNVWIEA